MSKIQRVAKFDVVSFDVFKLDVDMPLFDDYVASMYNRITLPRRATSGSAGYDICTPFDISLEVGETAIIQTGLRCIIDVGWVLMLAPRSGHGFKFRVQLDNTVGIIDSDYYTSENMGHIIIKITNDGKTGKRFCASAGTAIAQGILLPFGITKDDDADGERNGGFGSTDKRDAKR